MVNYTESTIALKEEQRIALTLIVDEELAPQIITNLGKDSFGDEVTKRLYIVAKEVYEQYGRVTKDLMYSNITSRLWWETLTGDGYEGREWIKSVLGKHKIFKITDLPDVFNLLEEKRKRRVLYRTSLKVQANALNTTEALTDDRLKLIKEQIVASLEELEETKFKEKDLVYNGENLEKSYQKAANDRLTKDFIGTGLLSIDIKLVEGLAPPGITILGGPTSAGKSLMIQTIALTHAMRGQPFILFCPEPQLLRTMDRLIAIKHQFPLYRIKQAFRKDNIHTHVDDRNLILQRAKEISKLPLYLIEKRGLTLASMFKIIKVLKKEINEKYPDKNIIWAIDLFKDLLDVNDANLQASHVSALMQRAEIETAETESHGILLIQFNRYYAHDENEKPELHHIEYGSAYEQKAMNIFFVTRPTFKDKTLEYDDTLNFWIEKQREGVAKTRVKLFFDGAKMQVRDLGEESETREEIEKKEKNWTDEV